MTRMDFPLAFLTTTLALSLPATAAGLTRTFVSSAGADSNPCTITQPCASFAQAYAATAAGGIIAALDPGKYGPLTITGPITINGNGWAAITAPARGGGITINGGVNGMVALTGLEIDGAGFGSNGIDFETNGGSANLVVDKCVVRNADKGILVGPNGTLDFTITNTMLSNNGTAGIYILPANTSNVNGVIDHVIATGAGNDGIDLDARASSGVTIIAVSNTIIGNNNNYGIVDSTGNNAITTLSIDNVSVVGNFNVGINVTGPATVLLGRSIVAANGIGVENNTTANTFYTYKDNRINLNGSGTDFAGTPLNTTFTPQ
jgi:hypothetical protein